MVLGLALAEQVDRLLRAVPALVAVHGEVAADDGADASRAGLRARRLDPRQRLRARRRRRVAPVGERVDDEVGDVALRREPDQRLEVLLGGVHAAARDEPDQVHALGGAQRGDQRLVLAQRPVLDGLVDPREVLRDDRARAEVEVAHLGVAHLARRQADGLAARGERGVRVLLPQPVEDRRVGECDRVARAVGREPPAVEHDEADRRHAHRAGAASTIAAKSDGSSEAPPTSAPSTSGSASSSAALDGLQEPP